jgi:hypothetical protein
MNEILKMQQMPDSGEPGQMFLKFLNTCARGRGAARNSIRDKGY